MINSHRQLSDTLLAYLDGVAIAGSADLRVTEALLEVPMEVTAESEHGRLALRTRPPFSRWRSGVLPVVHHCRIVLVLDDPESGGGGGW